MNSDQHEALLTTLEQAGTAKVRRAIRSGRWPRGEVRDLAEGWLRNREEVEREDARALAQTASMRAEVASQAANKSERNAKISNVIASTALALALAAFIAAVWPK